MDENITNSRGSLGESLFVRATNDGGSPLLLLLGVELLWSPASGGRGHRLHRGHLTTDTQHYFTLDSWNSVDIIIILLQIKIMYM
jgi:hypothetical protein